jgi:hypothetical protein
MIAGVKNHWIIIPLISVHQHKQVRIMEYPRTRGSLRNRPYCQMMLKDADPLR